MSSGPFTTVEVEFARPFLNLARKACPAPDAGADYRDLAARELSMLATDPLPSRRFGPIPRFR